MQTIADDSLPAVFNTAGIMFAGWLLLTLLTDSELHDQCNAKPPHWLSLLMRILAFSGRDRLANFFYFSALIAASD